MELPKRKKLRLENFDYDMPYIYFITICTANKKALFSRIVGALHEAPVETKLTPYGEIVKETIEFLPDKFNLRIHNFVIMPDHLHLLMEITDYEGALREAPLRSRSILSQSIGYLKADVSKKIHKTNPSLTVWQGRYTDHIIRNEKDYSAHFEYIENNPVMWAMNKQTRIIRT